MKVDAEHAPTQGRSALLTSSLADLTVNKIRANASRLHGRDQEVEKLLNVYGRVRNNRKSLREKRGTTSTVSHSELVLISGQSGTGKTALAHALKSSVKHKGDFYVSGKFDKQRQATPYSAFAAAFTELCEEIIRLKHCKIPGVTSRAISLFISLQSSLREAVGPESDALEEVIPNLSHIIGGATTKKSSRNLSIQLTMNRFSILLRRFVQGICGQLTLVLFIDDLQWADTASLDLLKALFADKDNAGLVIIGSYRDVEAESGNDYPSFREWLCSLERGNQDSGITRIGLRNLEPKSVNELVADLLRLTTNETERLSHTIHQKTHGNAYFVIEFLKSLNEKGILNYCLTDFEWKWDDDEVSRVHVTKNVADLLVEKMRDALSPEISIILQVASCLGSSFDASMLKLILRKFDPDSGDEHRVEKRLNKCIEEGFLAKNGEAKYHFVHDQIQDASLSLISKESVDLIQYRMGEVLLDNTPESELNNILFLVTELLNHGIEIVAEDDKRCDIMSQLNLRAGKRAMMTSAFDLATTYLESGIRMLGQNPWRYQYELSLELFSTAAEAECCKGNTRRMQKYLDFLLPNEAIQFQDKIRPYSTLIYSMCFQVKAHEAINIAFGILSKFSVYFPPKASKLVLLKNLAKTKHVLQGETMDSILCSQEMKGEKLHAMMIMDKLIDVTYCTRPSIVPLISFKMVRWSVRYGVSKYSTPAFVMFGVVLCGLGDIQGGNQYGKLAISLLKRLNARDMESKVHYIYDTFLSHWIQPAHSAQKKFLQNYNMGMQTGAVSYAMVSAKTACTHALHVGCPLPLLESDMRYYGGQIKEYRQAKAFSYLAPSWQFVLNMMGWSENPVILTGEAMVQEDFLRHCSEISDIALNDYALAHQLWLSYYFGNYELGQILIKKTKNLQRTLQSTPMVWRHALFEGLISFALAREKRSRYWKRQAVKVMKKMKKWILLGNANIKHSLILLEAENAALNGAIDEAQEKYQAAIATASRHGFLHDKALANERAGEFYLKIGDMDWASYYIKNSHQLYAAWGSKAKVDQLQGKYKDLINEEVLSDPRPDQIQLK